MLFDIVITKQEIDEYLSSINYPRCKIKEYLHIKDNKELQKYCKNIKSNQQINALLEIYKKYNYVHKSYPTWEIKNNLIKILCKGKDRYVFQIIDKRLKQPIKDDDTIYEFLRKLYHKKNKKIDLFPKNLLCSNVEITNEIIKYKFNQYIEKSKNYLDVGGADGYKSMKLAKTFDIKLNKVHVIDFSQFDGTTYRKVSSEINYHNLEINIPYPFKNGTFSLASCMMVLHHVQNIEFTLKELNRVIKKGGFLLIKEHDICGIIDNIYADIEHAMWEIVQRPIPNYDFKSEEYARYFSWFEWNILLKRYGFEPVEEHEYFFNSIYANVNTAKHYFMLYKKTNTL